MKAMTVGELKSSTGEVVRTLERGQRILLTFRGKAVGTIEPLRGEQPRILPYRRAWAEIEAQLRRSRPRFASWQEAENKSRGVAARRKRR